MFTGKVELLNFLALKSKLFSSISPDKSMLPDSLTARIDCTSAQARIESLEYELRTHEKAPMRPQVCVHLDHFYPLAVDGVLGAEGRGRDKCGCGYFIAGLFGKGRTSGQIFHERIVALDRTWHFVIRYEPIEGPLGLWAYSEHYWRVIAGLACLAAVYHNIQSIFHQISIDITYNKQRIDRL
ncbi:hypothetical protein BpHYR1_044102 [Brachionus plicatilis]|uniref:Uncharacterized protein n=1 Tax=Brachionus plicatilis TaxID=10195 RepID=A0A3M7Q8U8_BRAPC|nr:hypothetical protein BpHYR1_044102 [Brachionus plicatilis]